MISNATTLFLIIQVVNAVPIVDDLKLNCVADLADIRVTRSRMAMRDRVDDRLLSDSIELCGNKICTNYNRRLVIEHAVDSKQLAAAQARLLNAAKNRSALTLKAISPRDISRTFSKVVLTELPILSTIRLLMNVSPDSCPPARPPGNAGL